jgi:hypothetical protein
MFCDVGDFSQAISQWLQSRPMSLPGTLVSDSSSFAIVRGAVATDSTMAQWMCRAQFWLTWCDRCVWRRALVDDRRLIETANYIKLDEEWLVFARFERRATCVALVSVVTVFPLYCYNNSVRWRIRYPLWEGDDDDDDDDVHISQAFTLPGCHRQGHACECIVDNANTRGVTLCSAALVRAVYDEAARDASVVDIAVEGMLRVSC